MEAYPPKTLVLSDDLMSSFVKTPRASLRASTKARMPPRLLRLLRSQRTACGKKADVVFGLLE